MTELELGLGLARSFYHWKGIKLFVVVVVVYFIKNIMQINSILPRYV